MILWFNWSMFLWMYPVSKWLAVCSSGGKNMGWIIWQNLEVIKVNISFDNKRNLVKPMKNSKIHLIVQSIWLQYRKIRLLTPERFGQNETFTAWKVERKDESREKHINCVIPAQSSLGLSGWLWRTSGWCDVRIWGRLLKSSYYLGRSWHMMRPTLVTSALLKQEMFSSSIASAAAHDNRYKDSLVPWGYVWQQNQT